MNLENQTLKAIQTSKAYCKKQLEKENNPHIRQKIEHYIEALEKEETEILTKHQTVIDKYDTLKDTLEWKTK